MTLSEALNSSFNDYLQFCLSKNKLKFADESERSFIITMWAKRYWLNKNGQYQNG